MADPLSAAASIISLADIGIRGVNGLRHLYRSYKDAPKQVEQLRNEAPANWAVLMHMGQVFDTAAGMGSDALSREFFELGERGNACLNEHDKLLAHDDQPKFTNRQMKSRKSILGNKLRHFAKRHQLRSKYRLALAHKRDFQNIRESMNSILLAENIRVQLLKSQSMAIRKPASLNHDAGPQDNSKSSELPLVGSSSTRLLNIPQCSPGCARDCHESAKPPSISVLQFGVQGVWQAIVLTWLRGTQLKSHCHRCGSVSRASVARTVRWPIPSWFGPLVIQVSVACTLRNGLSCRLKLSRRVNSSEGDIFWCLGTCEFQQLQSLLKAYPAVINDQIGLDGRSPLHLAIHSAKPDMIMLLLENGADTAIEDDRGLNAAMDFAIYVLHGHFPKTDHYELHRRLCTTEILEEAMEYLQLGAVHRIVLNMLEIDLHEYLEGLQEDERLAQLRHTDGYGRTPLHLAAGRDKAEAVEILLSFGAEPNARNNDGRTPLASLAEYAKSAKSFKPLAQRGANVHARTKSGHSIIHVAAMRGALELIEQLYRFGVDINTPFANSTTPLMFAANWGHSEVIDSLLAWGTPVNTADNENCTALLYAIFSNAHESIELLLSQNANPQHVDKFGNTIWHQAAKTADARTMEILQSLKPTREDLTKRNKCNEIPFDLLRAHFRGRQEVWDMFANLSREAGGPCEITEET